MWQLKISILDFGGGTKNIVTWHFGHQKTIKGAHLVLLYNGSTHFIGTGNFFILGTCNTFYTVLINQTPFKLSQILSNIFLVLYHYIRQTLSNSVEPTHTFCNSKAKLIEPFQTISNHLKHILKQFLYVFLLSYGNR